MDTTPQLLFYSIAIGSLCLIAGFISSLARLLRPESPGAAAALLVAVAAQAGAMCCTTLRNVLSSQAVVGRLQPLWMIPRVAPSGVEFAVICATMTLLVAYTMRKQAPNTWRAAAGVGLAACMLLLFRGAWVREPVMMTVDLCDSMKGSGSQKFICDESGAPMPVGVCHSWVMPGYLVNVVLEDGQVAEVSPESLQLRAAVAQAGQAAKLDG